jgi:hypothetical protein
MGVYLNTSSAYDPCAPWLELKGSKMGIYRDDNDQGVELMYVRHWSLSLFDWYMIFSVNSTNQTEAINMVNSVFDNRGPMTTTTIPADCNPGALRMVTFVYGDGEEYGLGGTVPGTGRRRIGAAERELCLLLIKCPVWCGMQIKVCLKCISDKFSLTLLLS